MLFVMVEDMDSKMEIVVFPKVLETTGSVWEEERVVLASGKILWEIMSGTVTFFANLITGQAGVEGISGPVGIAVMAGKAADMGLLHLFYFTAVLSVSLGIFNLFPLPALDGGQLMLLLIETCRRKPLSLKAHQTVNLIGLGLFVALSVLVTYQDIIRLVT